MARSLVGPFVESATAQRHRAASATTDQGNLDRVVLAGVTSRTMAPDGPAPARAPPDCFRKSRRKAEDRRG